MEDLQALLRAWAAADVKATAAEKLVTELQLSGERPSEKMILQALQFRAEATAARESVTRLVAS